MILTFTIFNALYETNVPAEAAELFPVSFRYTGLALTLNLTNGIAGGLAPIVASVLYHDTNMLISPMFYIIFLGLITLFSLRIGKTSYQNYDLAMETGN